MKRNRRQKHLVFPKAPHGFWNRFQRRWSNPLKMLEEVISLSESFGAEAGAPRFKVDDRRVLARGAYTLEHASMHGVCWHCSQTGWLIQFGPNGGSATSWLP